MNQIDRSNPKYWKWNMFYYNPDDPEYYVDKRFGIGQTINFAHRTAVLTMLFVIFFPSAVITIALYLLGYL